MSVNVFPIDLVTHVQNILQPSFIGPLDVAGPIGIIYLYCLSRKLVFRGVNPPRHTMHAPHALADLGMDIMLGMTDERQKRQGGMRCREEVSLSRLGEWIWGLGLFPLPRKFLDFLVENLSLIHI